MFENLSTKRILIICIVLLGSSISVLADPALPPICPDASVYHIIFANKSNLGELGPAWADISNVISSDWNSVYVAINDINIKTPEQAIMWGDQIEKSQNGIVEQKIYRNLGHYGPYFWVCQYAIAPKYVAHGDSMQVFSPTYYEDGVLATVQYTDAQKLQLLEKLK